MKKRFWIPAVLVVGISGLCAIAFQQWEDDIKKANAGDMKACKSFHKWVAEDPELLERFTKPECRKFLSTPYGAEGSATSLPSTQKDKTHPDFQGGGLSDYDRCLKTRAQVNKVEPGKGDELFKCEELKSYLKPTERVKAAERQRLVQKCEETIRSGLKDPSSYRFVKRDYIATANNGLDVRITYSATNSFGGRLQKQQSCSYSF